MAKVTLKREFDTMPIGAKVGEEIEVNDRDVERLQREGSIESRATASNQLQGDRLTRPSANVGADANTGAPGAQQGQPKVSDAAQRAEYDRVNQQRDKQNERTQRDDSNR